MNYCDLGLFVCDCERLSVRYTCLRPTMNWKDLIYSCSGPCIMAGRVRAESFVGNFVFISDSWNPQVANMASLFEIKLLYLCMFSILFSGK